MVNIEQLPVEVLSQIMDHLVYPEDLDPPNLADLDALEKDEDEDGKYKVELAMFEMTAQSRGNFVTSPNLSYFANSTIWPATYAVPLLWSKPFMAVQNSELMCKA